MGQASLLKSSLHLNEPIGILGFGVEGQSTLGFLQRMGYKNILVLDKNPGARPDNIPGYFGDSHQKHLDKIKTLIRSAGIRPDSPQIKSFMENGGTITSQVEILFDLAPKDKIIAVTGTMGKGTCCSLIQKMMEDANVPHVLGGNIGIAALDLLEKFDIAKDWPYIILELSSFQLYSLKKSPKYAVVLKTTSEHLDWHLSQKEYWEAKANLVKQQQPNDICIYSDLSEGSRYIAGLSKAQKMAVGKHRPFLITSDKMELSDGPLYLKNLKLKGAFNLENIAAAAAIGQFLEIPPPKMRHTFSRFKGLKHRLEFLGESEQMEFYNDSYATRPDATLGALKNFESQSLFLILGGSEKNADFSELGHYIAHSTHIKKIALIGATAQRLEQEILKHKNQSLPALKHCQQLEDSLKYLLESKAAGVCLLSPACASFGLFKNYGERGDRFRELVQNFLKKS